MSDTAPLDRTKPLLVIEDTQDERYFVTIYGIDYFIRERMDLGLVEIAKLESIVTKYGDLITRATAGRDLSVTEAERLKIPIEETIRIFLPDLPEDQLQRLRPRERIALVMSFNEALLARPEPPTPIATNRANRRTGARSSRASSASTAPRTRSPGRK